MMTATRTWTKTTMGRAVEWLADGAIVRITSPARGVWHLYAVVLGGVSWGMLADETHGTRQDAMVEARGWIRRLARPLY